MNTKGFFSTVLMMALSASTAYRALAQQPTPQTREASSADQKTQTGGETLLTNLLAKARPNRRAGFSLMPSSSAKISEAAFNISPAATGPNLAVLGGGTPGRLPKWTGFTSSNSFIGDSSIYEDKFGKVGIGTDSPTSKLTVAGTIEATEGFKFPASAHDATLKGDGTTASPLGVAAPLNLAGTASGFVGIVSGTNNGNGAGVAGTAPGGVGVIGSSETDNGVFGQSNDAFGVRGRSFSSSAGIAGVTGSCDNCEGVFGSSTSKAGVHGKSTSSAGVIGESTDSDGLNGRSESGRGVVGGSVNNNGVLAVTGSASSSAAGLVAMGSTSATGGIAGIFFGKVEITSHGSQPGDLTVAGKLIVTSGLKMFHIDHPLDPENKYLNHAAIESSEVLNVYSNNVTTDANGDAVVELPEWFESLNKDFRYQLTVIGTFAQAIVAERIKGNRFAIKTNAPNVEVSWQVTGVRSDATARKYRFEIEEAKAERDRGYYLNPDAYDQPEEKGIQWARDPKGMEELKQRRIEAERVREQKQQPNQR